MEPKWEQIKGRMERKPELIEGQEEQARDRARRMGVPYVEPLRPVQPQLPNPIVAVCGGCGRDVHRVEGYSCPRDNCPIQPRISM